MEITNKLTPKVSQKTAYTNCGYYNPYEDAEDLFKPECRYQLRKEDSYEDEPRPYLYTNEKYSYLGDRLLENLHSFLCYFYENRNYRHPYTTLQLLADFNADTRNITREIKELTNYDLTKAAFHENAQVYPLALAIPNLLIAVFDNRNLVKRFLDMFFNKKFYQGPEEEGYLRAFQDDFQYALKSYREGELDKEELEAYVNRYLDELEAANREEADIAILQGEPNFVQRLQGAQEKLKAVQAAWQNSKNAFKRRELRQALDAARHELHDATLIAQLARYTLEGSRTSLEKVPPLLDVDDLEPLLFNPAKRHTIYKDSTKTINCAGQVQEIPLPLPRLEEKDLYSEEALFFYENTRYASLGMAVQLMAHMNDRMQELAAEVEEYTDSEILAMSNPSKGDPRTMAIAFIHLTAAAFEDQDLACHLIDLVVNQRIANKLAYQELFSKLSYSLWLLNTKSVSQAEMEARVWTAFKEFELLEQVARGKE